MNDNREKNNETPEDFLNSEKHKEYVRTLKEKEKSIKSGKNVIHLDYYAPLITESDLTEYEDILEHASLELSHFDKSGVFYASFEDFTNAMFVAIQQPLIQSILTGLASSVTWDSIKYVIIKTWEKVRNKNITKLYAGNETEKKPLTFGMHIKLGKNTEFNFRLDGSISDEVISDSLDKGLNFLREQKLNSNPKLPYLVVFNSENGKWEKIDVEEKIMSKKDKSGETAL
jgi:hypothetical protein